MYIYIYIYTCIYISDPSYHRPNTRYLEFFEDVCNRIVVAGLKMPDYIDTSVRIQIYVNA